MSKVKEEIIKFKEERGWGSAHKPLNLAISISLESAELLEHFQWGDEVNYDEVKDELADVLIYCHYLADALGVEVDDIILNKLKKQALKYPVK